MRPAPDELPSPENYEISKWEMGTLNYEGLAGVVAAVDYVASLGGGTDVAQSNRRDALEQAWQRIGAHEGAMSSLFLSGLDSIPGVGLYGLSLNDVDTSESGAHVSQRRTSTFALRKDGLLPAELASRLVQRGVLCCSGNFYALALSEHLGLESVGGFARVGFLHYNTMNEVERVLQAIEDA